MKKILIVIAILVSVGLYLYTGDSSRLNEKELGILGTNESDFEYEYFIDRNKGIYSVLFSKTNVVQLFHNDTETPVAFEEFSSSTELLVAINASYFLDDYSHAGLLLQDGNRDVHLAPNDVQLTHVVELGNSISFISNSDFGKLLDASLIQEDSSYFQSGPLIIDENNVQTDTILESLNGFGKYRRSVLGVSDEYYFFLSTTRSYTLTDLADEILAIPQLKSSTVSAINLDGGSSVAIQSNENEEVNLGKTKKIPYILGVK